MEDNDEQTGCVLHLNINSQLWGLNNVALAQQELKVNMEPNVKYWGLGANGSSSLENILLFWHLYSFVHIKFGIYLSTCLLLDFTPNTSSHYLIASHRRENGALKLGVQSGGSWSKWRKIWVKIIIEWRDMKSEITINKIWTLFFNLDILASCYHFATMHITREDSS